MGNYYFWREHLSISKLGLIHMGSTLDRAEDEPQPLEKASLRLMAVPAASSRALELLYSLVGSRLKNRRDRAQLQDARFSICKVQNSYMIKLRLKDVPIQICGAFPMYLPFDILEGGAPSCRGRAYWNFVRIYYVCFVVVPMFVCIAEFVRWLDHCSGSTRSFLRNVMKEALYIYIYIYIYCGPTSRKNTWACLWSAGPPFRSWPLELLK